MYRILPTMIIFSSLYCSTSPVNHAGNTAHLNSKKYVTAESGLILREGPGLTYKRITLLPMNTAVAIKEYSNNMVTISGKTGRWARVETATGIDNVQQGWCFEAFLADSPVIHDCDVVYDADPAVNLIMNRSYSRNDVDNAIQSSLEDNYIPGSSEHFWDEIIFSGDGRFKYSINSSHSFERGESFRDSLIYTGTYMVKDKVVHLKYLKCRYVQSSSSEPEYSKARELSIEKCPHLLRSAETDEKCFLKSSEGRVYIHNKKNNY